jgi:transposase-like protein
MGDLRLRRRILKLEYIRELSQFRGLDMTVIVDGQIYYRTAEVCRIVGISRATLFRWLKEDIFKEAKHRDRRGWRLFTEEEVERLKAEANRVNNTDQVEIAKGLL